MFVKVKGYFPFKLSSEYLLDIKSIILVDLKKQMVFLIGVDTGLTIEDGFDDLIKALSSAK